MKTLLRKLDLNGTAFMTPEANLLLAQVRKDLRVAVSLPYIDLLELLSKHVYLPRARGLENRKSWVLELEKLLVSCTESDTPRSGPCLNVQARPGARRLLTAASKQFEVIVFTTATQEVADEIVKFLDPKRTRIHHVICRDRCVRLGKHLIKDLRIFANRSLENIAIVDTCCIAFSKQLENGVPLRAWTGDPKDSVLFQLEDYLKVLAREDIRKANRQRFNLDELAQQAQAIFFQVTQKL